MGFHLRLETTFLWLCTSPGVDVSQFAEMLDDSDSGTLEATEDLPGWLNAQLQAWEAPELLGKAEQDRGLLKPIFTVPVLAPFSGVPGQTWRGLVWLGPVNVLRHIYWGFCESWLCLTDLRSCP